MKFAVEPLQRRNGVTKELIESLKKKKVCVKDVLETKKI